MSIPGDYITGAPFFHELKKQASFFLKEKIRTARLALTDVTPAQLLTEEATNGNPWAPDTRTLRLISRAAFDIDDYWRIVEILHKRLSKFDRKNWRESYKALVLLDYLLIHGPESIAPEFHIDEDVIRETGSFQHVDERGFNWGLAVRKKSERILQLLEKGALLKEERTRARKLTRGIEGFGSLCQRPSSSANETKKDFAYERSNSQYADYDSDEESRLPSWEEGVPKLGQETGKDLKVSNLITENDAGNSKSVESFQKYKRSQSARQPLQENFAERNSQIVNTTPKKKVLGQEIFEQACSREAKALLGTQPDESRPEFLTEDHPFNSSQHTPTASLLSVKLGDVEEDA